VDARARKTGGMVALNQAAKPAIFPTPPPTRELAGSLGLNRTTVAAALVMKPSDSSSSRQLRRGATFRKLQSPTRLDPPARTPGRQPPTSGAKPAFPASCQLRHFPPLRATVSAGRLRASCRNVMARSRFRPRPATRLSQRIPAAAPLPARRRSLQETRPPPACIPTGTNAFARTEDSLQDRDKRHNRFGEVCAPVTAA
jgi:hypothetical protein